MSRQAKGNREVLSTADRVAFDRGQELKKVVRAAAALQGWYDDVRLSQEVDIGRNSVRNWWEGAKPEPGALRRLAAATGLSLDELTAFVYYEGPPPSVPAVTRRLSPEGELIADELEQGPSAKPRPRPHPIEQ